MADPKHILFLDLFVTAMAIWDLARTLRTGRASLWLGGTATRAHQPARYWRRVYSTYVALAFLAATFLWASIWPDSLR